MKNLFSKLFGKNLALVSSLIFVVGVIGTRVSVGDPLNSSLFQISTIWKDQNNKDFKIENVRGTKTIIGMIYTGCAHACPMTISKIQDILKNLSKKEKYRVLLVSFDHKKDKPEVLLKLMTSRKLDQEKWTFLTHSEDPPIRELSLVLGLSYKELEDGNFSHSNALNLLDENGNIISRMEGLNSPIEPFVEKLKGEL